MDRLQDSTIHIHVTVIFDWKMMAVIVCGILIRLK